MDVYEQRLVAGWVRSVTISFGDIAKALDRLAVAVKESSQPTPVDFERVGRNLTAHTQDAIDFFGPGDTDPPVSS